MDKEQLYLNILNQLFHGVCVIDRDLRFQFWNEGARHLTGHSPQEVLGQRCDSGLLPHLGKEGLPLYGGNRPLENALPEGAPRRVEMLLLHKQGHRVPVLMNLFPLMEEGKLTGIIEIFSPSAPNPLLETLASLGQNDPITQLPGRQKVEMYLDYQLQDLRRMGTKIAVIMLNLDGFAAFNQIYGSAMGDEILRGVGHSVQHNLRKSDLFGRLESDCFVGVFAIRDMKEVQFLAEKTRGLVYSTQLIHQGNPLRVTASLGATAARNEDTVDTLLSRAEALMRQSKQAGRDRYTLG